MCELKQMIPFKACSLFAVAGLHTEKGFGADWHNWTLTVPAPHNRCDCSDCSDSFRCLASHRHVSFLFSLTLPLFLKQIRFFRAVEMSRQPLPHQRRLCSCEARGSWLYHHGSSRLLLPPVIPIFPIPSNTTAVLATDSFWPLNIPDDVLLLNW
jgi:hypothetical protein